MHHRKSLAELHFFEEPCISGEKGSGTVFFSGCNLSCKFCQNYKISQEYLGKEIEIDEQNHISLDKTGNSIFWAEKQQLVSSADATNYSVSKYYGPSTVGKGLEQNNMACISFLKPLNEFFDNEISRNLINRKNGLIEKCY